MEKNAQCQSKLDDLFDIANAKALYLISIEEDRAFLIAQWQKSLFGFLLGKDKKMIKKEKKTIEDQIQTTNKRYNKRW